VQTKEGLITSDAPVKVAMEAGSITANHMTVRQKTKEYTFTDEVRTILQPKKSSPAAGAATPTAKGPLSFGASEDPITVTANRLDINDVAKTALFSGTVVAEQAGNRMTSPELEVAYEGAATPGSTTGTTASAGTKLKRIYAKSSVELRQATGETATSRTAEFDPVKQLAILEGDVVMVQGADKRATGDRAEFDRQSNTVILTGPVTLTQGQNALRGGRLVFNQQTNQMQLTTPGASGRVFARFQQQPETKAADATEGAAATQKGIPFAATFKMSPGAPVSVEAATLDVDDAAKQAVFRGKVRAVQGDFVIQSAEMTAAYSGSAGFAGGETGKQGAAQLSTMKARNSVQITSNDGQKATGDWADFDSRANTATLGGDVVLTQGKNIVRGTKLVIDMTTGQSVLNTEPTAGGSGAKISSSGADGQGPITNSQRPSAVFYPGEMKVQQQEKTSSPKTAVGGPQRTQP
jgi:lipopolysaccharide transport protein LptA